MSYENEGTAKQRGLGWAKSSAVTLYLQVVREVAVLDNINPGGMYASRVKMLGRCKSFPGVLTAFPERIYL